MAETVTLNRGGKKIPKTYLYAGLAAVVGIVGYAWWTKGTKGNETPAPVFDEFGNPIAGPTPGLAGPTVVDSNLSTTAATGFQTNAEWTQFATSYLQGLGLEAGVVSSAIGKFIQRKPLAKLEADIVGQAVAAAGWPPEDRPWTIIPEAIATPPAPTPVPEPVGPITVHASAGPGGVWTRFTWNAIPGRGFYTVYPVRESPLPRTELGIRAVTGTEWIWYNTFSGAVLTVVVIAYDPQERELSRGQITFRVP